MSLNFIFTGGKRSFLELIYDPKENYQVRL